MCISDYLTYRDVQVLECTLLHAKQFVANWLRSNRNRTAPFADGEIDSLRYSIIKLRIVINRALQIMTEARAKQLAAQAAAEVFGKGAKP